MTVSVLTLGEGVDRLQDRYRERENMTAAYMAEVISNEILMKAMKHMTECLQKPRITG